MDLELQREEPYAMGDRRNDSVDPELLDPDDSLVIAAKKQGGFLGRIKLGVLKAYNYLIRLHGSPEEIAWGLALGLFIAMTPTVGLQMMIAVPIASLFRVNSAAAAAGCWLTNPLTIPFLYGLNYWVGATLLGYDGTFVIEGALTFEILLAAGRDVWLSLIVGGFVTGAICAAVSYYPTIYLVRAGRKTLERRRARRAKRRAARAAKRAAKKKKT